MIKSGARENMGGFIYSWLFPYWKTCPCINDGHSTHFVIIGEIVYKSQGKALLLQNLQNWQSVGEYRGEQLELQRVSYKRIKFIFFILFL